MKLFPENTGILQDAYEGVLYMLVVQPPTERPNFARNGVIWVEEGTRSNDSIDSMLVRSYSLVIKHGNGKYLIYR